MEQSLPTSSLKVPYDTWFYNEGSKKFEAWKQSILNPSVTEELEVFVAQQLNSCDPVKFVKRVEGSYNMMFQFHMSTGNDVALRIPKPGHTPWALVTEKMANEVAWMRYFKANTSIPVPKLYCSSLQTPNNLSPLKLPFILMDFIEGHNLREYLTSLKAPGTDADADTMRSTVYEQLADFYLQLNRLHFEAIGSIAESVPGQWKMQRPLTMDMHQCLLGIPNYPTGEWPTEPLRCSTDYFDFVAAQQHDQLWKLRNLNVPHDCEKDIDLKQAAQIAQKRFKARKGFKDLITLFCPSNDRGPFLPFNPDLDPRNMVVNPDTGVITGVFDLEFTNAMPAQFARDPPLWLHRVLPGQCLEEGFFPWFLQTYRPYLDLFLAAMKRVEQRGQTGDGEMLSTLMLESWASNRCWFNYAAHNADHVDAVYWELLQKLHPGGSAPELSTDMESEMERYLRHNETQIAAFEKEW
ncbi:phosphotransferase enzyme family protein [Colletotrichum tofieldiae]|nr:phosphotransferase enzyme family protein [Colletotrichum tofieldiae]GKT73496.1 phosphotransferase enzyme family protein [Colletotrichum tofieldiae]GKT87801.1 phosphotransferase enzyme family protein [Colletotrichum tofieldiae]